MPSSTATLTSIAQCQLEAGATKQQAITAANRAIALGNVPGATPEEALDTVSAVFAASEVTQEKVTEANESEGTELFSEYCAEEQGDALGARDRVLYLPPWHAVNSTTPPKAAPELVSGLLRRGHVGLLVAKAKSNKSWSSIALSVAVATGMPWLGFPCTQGTVVYCDPEIDRRSLDRRFHKVAKAMGANHSTVDANVIRWSLRGVSLLLDNGTTRAPIINDIAHDLGMRVGGACEGDVARGSIALVVLDSCSALLSGDENSSADVRAFFNTCLRIAETTGGAVLAVHHEGKARSGDRSAADRSRGSSVWTDAPDLVLSLAETFPPSGSPSDYLNDGERAFTLEIAAIREFPMVAPKRLIWSFPMFSEDAGGITDCWNPKSSQQNAGRKSGETRALKSDLKAAKCEAAILAHLYHDGIGDEGIKATEAKSVCDTALGESIGLSTLKAFIERSDLLDLYQPSPRRCMVVPAHVRPRQLE